MKLLIYIVLFNLMCLSLAFSAGFERLTPKETDKDFYIHGDGIFVYTSFDEMDYHYRHSYNYINLNTAYELGKNYWISNLIKIQKASFSYELKEPHKVHFFPQLAFIGSIEEVFFYQKGSWFGKNLIKGQVGVLPNATFSKGLFYSQFTGLGIGIKSDFEWFSLDLYGLGSGFDDSDDVFGFYIYSPKRYVGIGILNEINTRMGDRIVPEINFEITFGDFRLFAETGIHFLYNRSYMTRNNKTEFQEYIVSFNPYIIPSFRKDFNLTRETIAALTGAEWTFKTRFWNIEGNLALEGRYYGREHVDFYVNQRYHTFDFYTDLDSDRLYNNQPFNFYLYSGNSYGAYFRQEIKFNPIGLIYLDIRNEILYIRYEKILKNGNKRILETGNDIIVASLYIQSKYFKIGFKVSNLLIGPLEDTFFNSTDKSIYSRGKRHPYLLEPSENLIMELFAYFHF